MSRWLLAALVLLLVSCGKPDNPLLSASDGQFARLVEPKNAFSPSCAAALYDPGLLVKQYNGLKFGAAGKISAVSEQHKSECIAELQKRAAEGGIRGEVMREHLIDDRVRQRYFAARKG